MGVSLGTLLDLGHLTARHVLHVQHGHPRRRTAPLALALRVLDCALLRRVLISIATNWFGTQSPLMCVSISWRVPRAQPIFSSSRRDGAAAAHFVLPFCSIQLRQQNLFENCTEKRPKIRLRHSSKKRKKG